MKSKGRPSESSLGICAERVSSGEVQIAITDAKVEANADRDLRVLKVPQGNRWYARLAERFADGKSMVLPASAASPTSTIWAEVDQLWPPKRNAVTAHCFRHAAVSEWKQDRYHRTSIALMLGHRSEQMQAYGGGRGTGDELMSPSGRIKVEATQAGQLKAGSRITGKQRGGRSRTRCLGLSPMSRTCLDMGALCGAHLSRAMMLARRRGIRHQRVNRPNLSIVRLSSCSQEPHLHQHTRNACCRRCNYCIDAVGPFLRSRRRLPKSRRRLDRTKTAPHKPLARRPHKGLGLILQATAHQPSSRVVFAPTRTHHGPQ